MSSEKLCLRSAYSYTLRRAFKANLTKTIDVIRRFVTSRGRIVADFRYDLKTITQSLNKISS